MRACRKNVGHRPPPKPDDQHRAEIVAAESNAFVKFCMSDTGQSTTFFFKPC
jgi:hypothetical protein